MLLDGALSAAAGGLDAISRRLAVVSQNVTNASTEGYVRETLAATSVSAAGEGMGVRSGVAIRTMDTALQTDLLAIGSHVAGNQTRHTALAGIDAASGAPGSGQDLASLVGALRDSFSALANDPGNSTQQRNVVAVAAQLAQGANGLSTAIVAARQNAQETLRDGVVQANAALRTLGSLSLQVIAARSRGQSTADLEDKRDAAANQLIGLTGAQLVPQPNGDLLVVSGGTVLPTHGDTDPTRGPLSIGDATLAADTPAAAVPPLRVDGRPAALGGGRLGAALDLRDRVLPATQATLDSFAQSLASGFATAGLTLFTDAAGALPTGPGAASVIQVATAVQATPSIVRDGAATPGPAGSTTLIDAVLAGVLASGPGTVTAAAAQLVADNAAAAATAQRQLTSDQAVQTSLAAKLTAQTGVSVDSEMAEMVQLQNSYGANARVISTVQQLLNQLLNIAK